MIDNEFEKGRIKDLEDRKRELLLLINKTLTLTETDKEKKSIEKQVMIESILKQKISFAQYDQIVNIILRRNGGWLGWNDFLGNGIVYGYVKARNDEE